jgi:anti-sigma factor RsiW
VELQEQDIALLEAYIAGNLSAEEATRCAQRLQAEPALAEAHAIMRQLSNATRPTVTAQLREDFRVAQAAAVAAGMAAYQPSIPPPPPTGAWFWRLFKSLLGLGVTLVSVWAIWKFVPQLQGPLEGGNISGPGTTTTTTTTTTIKRDTTVRHDTIRNQVKTPSK